MPFTTTWYNDEKTIIISTAYAPWTWDEYADAGAQVHQMFGEVGHPVAHITDYTPAAHVNPPAAGVRNLPRLAAFMRHENFLLHVDVGITKPLGRMLSNIFAQTYGKHATAETVEQALEVIAEARQHVT